MALTNDAQPFRFMDLPGEIRNKVYGFLLCAFDEAPEEYDPGDYLLACPTRNFTFVTHSVDTAILCTNSKIHREAYDFMVKTNRFVRVSCLRGLPIITMLRIHRVPVVTVQRSLEHFKGYVLDITFSLSKPACSGLFNDLPPMSAMMLACDLGIFCKSISFALQALPAYKSGGKLEIDVGPVCAQPSVRYKDDLTDFFSDTTQKVLLNPLRTLRNHKIVEVRGSVSKELAAAVKKEMVAEDWKNPTEILKALTAKKDQGMEMYHQNDFPMATEFWVSTAMEIESLRRGPLWSQMLLMGGEQFLNEIADLQFRLGINLALSTIRAMNSFSPITLEIEIDLESLKIKAEQGIIVSATCSAPDYWQKGFTWECPDVLRAKLLYRKAVCTRLWGEKNEADRALELLHDALELVPGDPLILRELQNVIQWSSGH